MTQQREAVVQNAADPRQVGRGTKLEKQRREKELNDMQTVLASRQGRRTLWRILGHCGVFGSVMSTTGRIEYNSGRQDAGHYILAEILAADESCFLLMQEEAYADAKSDNAMIAATHIPRATPEEQAND